MNHVIFFGPYEYGSRKKHTKDGREELRKHMASIPIQPDDIEVLEKYADLLLTMSDEEKDQARHRLNAALVAAGIKEL